MNMLAPMNDNSYQDHVKAVRSACQTVAKNSMPNAAGEVKTFYEAEEDGVFKILPFQEMGPGGEVFLPLMELLRPCQQLLARL